MRVCANDGCGPWGVGSSVVFGQVCQSEGAIFAVSFICGSTLKPRGLLLRNNIRSSWLCVVSLARRLEDQNLVHELLWGVCDASFASGVGRDPSRLDWGIESASPRAPGFLPPMVDHAVSRGNPCHPRYKKNKRACFRAYKRQ